MHFLCEYNQVRFTSRWNWNLEMLFFREGGKPENPEKNPLSKDENQQQAQPTYDTGTWSRTRATLVGGERSHHCAIPAPLLRRMSKQELWAGGREQKIFLTKCRTVVISCESKRQRSNITSKYQDSTVHSDWLVFQDSHVRSSKVIEWMIWQSS